MTPEQFFDQLDEIFGEVDGYINHLQRIKELQEQYSKAVQDINQRDFERTSLLREIKELKEEVESKSSKKKKFKTTD
jgi:cell shape-determining protein MreC